MALSMGPDYCGNPEFRVSSTLLVMLLSRSVIFEADAPDVGIAVRTSRSTLFGRSAHRGHAHSLVGW